MVSYYFPFPSPPPSCHPHPQQQPSSPNRRTVTEMRMPWDEDGGDVGRGGGTWVTTASFFRGEISQEEVHRREARKDTLSRLRITRACTQDPRVQRPLIVGRRNQRLRQGQEIEDFDCVLQ